MDGLLTGKLSYVFLVAILDSAVLSWLGLLWYRHSVRSLMRQRADSRTTTAEARETAPRDDGAAPRLEFALYEADGTGVARSAAGLSPERRRRLVRAYVAGAAVYSLIVTTIPPALSGEPLGWIGWFGLWWINGWPLVPTLIALLVLDRRSLWRLTAGYVLAGALGLSSLTLFAQLARGAVNTAPLTNPLWMAVGLGWTASVPLLLILLTGWRRIRAVTPLALASTLIFGFALMLFREGLIRVFDFGPVQRSLLTLAMWSSTQIVYYGLFLLLSLPVGGLAWAALRLVAGRFERKAFSDVQLVVDCWWLIAAAEVVMVLSTKLGARAIVVGLVAFLGYRVAVAIGLRGSRNESSARPRRLLLLRVFGYQSRTERLFDRVAARWRLGGPVQLIAGVDLAMRTVDPSGILRLLAGRLVERYVDRATDVSALAARLDERPDPDGRFRVNDLYCHDDTWRPAVQALLDTCDCVVMDLRSFSEQNQGCIFELEQLVWRLPSDAIVLIIDRSTDLAHLGPILDRAWSAAQRAGQARGEGRLSLVRVERSAWRELEVLWGRLIGQATPGRVLSSDGLIALSSGAS
jgi:hypothetical protein